MPLSKLFDPSYLSRERVRGFLRERVVRKSYNLSIGLVPRSPDPYSTHLPILCAVAAFVQPTRVVEYGSGMISTITFLNRAVFPKLTALVSLENNREWYETMGTHSGVDPRLRLRFVDGPMRDAVSKDDLNGAEVVFVDDDDSTPPHLPRRSDTIVAIAALRPSGIPIVIHDIECWHLRHSAARFDHFFRFDALHPQTGVVWNDRWEGEDRLPAINRLVRQFCKTVSSRDLQQWVHIFSTQDL